MSRVKNISLFMLLLALPVWIFFSRAWTMQKRFFENEAIRLFWYDMVDAFDWVLVYAAFYFITYFISCHKLAMITRIVLSAQIWSVFWNCYDEYVGQNSEVHTSEYWFFIFLIAHATWQLIDVKRKISGNRVPHR